MSHTTYTLAPSVTPQTRNPFILRYAASGSYFGDWTAIPHSHNCTELLYIVNGYGQFQICDQIFTGKSRQLIVVNPNITYTLSNHEQHPLEFVVIGIDGLQLISSDTEKPECLVYSLSPDDGIYTCIKNILHEVHNQKSEYKIICQAYIDIIVSTLIRKNCDSITQEHHPVTRASHCSAVYDYINQNYREKISLDQLAEMFGMNKYYMAHAFKRKYGMSLINYLNACRIQEGKRLLAETELSTSQISAILGFSSPSYFSQIFRNAEGISPTEYRKTNPNNS